MGEEKIKLTKKDKKEMKKDKKEEKMKVKKKDKKEEKKDNKEEKMKVKKKDKKEMKEERMKVKRKDTKEERMEVRKAAVNLLKLGNLDNFFQCPNLEILILIIDNLSFKIELMPKTIEEKLRKIKTFQLSK